MLRGFPIIRGQGLLSAKMEKALSSSFAVGLGASKSHPLVEELRGIVQQLKKSGVPVKDGSIHLIPLCESIESILRHGLKSPNSWFGINKQDYWSWIEPLQDYYFNQKENPLLREVVQAVATAKNCRSVVGCGRCFIRVALCQKLISVPIEHLSQNKRLTQYWYSNDSIIGDAALRESLMSVLFEVTDVDFQLSVTHSSFLDETWTMPIFQTLSVAPVKTLNIKLSYVNDRALIVEVEKDCLAERAGVEVGDVLDELCGTPVHGTSHGKLKQTLMANSVDSTDFVIVKKHLQDGCLFFPILQRQIVSDERAGITERKLTRRSTAWAKSRGQGAEYSVMLLGKDQPELDRSTEASQALIDRVISQVLTNPLKPQNVVMSVSTSGVSLRAQDSQEMLPCWGFSDVCSCGRGELHQTCLVLLVASQSSSLSAYVLETASTELAQAVCAHIAKGFTGSSG